ncbi:MAG: protein phosphatase CheZ [Cohaesibacter sp.]|jgi:hypothetical protein|nr:protein phosphatase CheZ [Cohaesibacter sp.]
MSKPTPPTPLRQEDYQAIEAAVMETARGRWFLSEYARRNRTADTDTLLGAIDKLEKTVVGQHAPGMAIERLKGDLSEIAQSIEKTKLEIAQIKHEDSVGTERFARASNELDAIVSQTENATGEILGAAEKIQEDAWTLREQGADEAHCNSLDEQATNIYMACSFQDLTGQRIQKIVSAMQYVEKRINTMIDIWGLEGDEVDLKKNAVNKEDDRPDAHLLNGPALEGEGVDQNLVDSMFDGDFDAIDAGSPDTCADVNQNDVDALFDSPTPSQDTPSEIELDAVNFDEIKFDAIDSAPSEEMSDNLAVEAQQEDEIIPCAEDENSKNADHPPMFQSSSLAEENAEADPAIETDMALAESDMFETVSSDEQEEAIPVERSENGIEVVETEDLDWADSVSLEDLEQGDVFASSAQIKMEDDSSVEGDPISMAALEAGDLSADEIMEEELLQAKTSGDANAQEEANSSPASDNELDLDFDMIGADELDLASSNEAPSLEANDELVAEMQKVAAEMDRVAGTMGLDNAPSQETPDTEQGKLDLDAQESPALRKRIIDFS